MNVKKSIVYVIPQVEVVEVEVEKGFAASGTGVESESMDVRDDVTYG